ncbi:MAG TPA: hypothetical protein VFS05_01005, partial [Gemmatimonadaceae bacterium]|nr:hypothetical protein [Gemmatimonadaceae bacterium]
HYDALRARRRGLVAAPGELLARIDAALAAVDVTSDIGAARARPVVVALGGIRRGLFPDAEPFRLPPAPGPLEAAAA